MISEVHAGLSQGGILAILSGAAFALIPIAYKLGQSRGVSSMKVMLVMAMIGTTVFGFCSLPVLREGVPLRVVLFAVAAGVGQYLAARLVGVTLKMGPMSAMWCAISLFFVPVVFYGVLFLDQRLLALQYLAMALATGAVIVASFSQHTPAGQKTLQIHHRVLYFLALAALLLTNSIFNMGISDLSVRQLADGQTFIVHYGTTYFFIAQLCITAMAMADLLWRRQMTQQVRWSILLGGLAGVGSLIGNYTLGYAANSGGPIVFPISGAVGLLLTSFSSAILFAEKRNLAWYITVILSILAVVLGNFDPKWFGG